MGADGGPLYRTASNNSNQTNSQAIGQEQTGTACNKANANKADNPANTNKATNNSANCSPTACRSFN